MNSIIALILLLFLFSLPYLFERFFVSDEVEDEEVCEPPPPEKNDIVSAIAEDVAKANEPVIIEPRKGSILRSEDDTTWDEPSVHPGPDFDGGQS